MIIASKYYNMPIKVKAKPKGKENSKETKNKTEIVKREITTTSIMNIDGDFTLHQRNNKKTIKITTITTITKSIKTRLGFY